MFQSINANVRRYVALPQSRGGACFCTRGAMQDYDVVLFIVALAKTVTPGGGPRREPGRAVPLTTKQSSLARRFSWYGEAMTYTDLLAFRAIYSFDSCTIFSKRLYYSSSVCS
jgi:hypothetical protein